MATIIKVRATAVCYYDEERKRIGDVFTLKPRTGTFTELVLDRKTNKPERDKNGFALTQEVEKVLSAEDQFNPKCMERVPLDTPDKITTGNEELRRQHDEVMRAKLGLPAATATPATPATGDSQVI